MKPLAVRMERWLSLLWEQCYPGRAIEHAKIVLRIHTSGCIQVVSLGYCQYFELDGFCKQLNPLACVWWRNERCDHPFIFCSAQLLCFHHLMYLSMLLTVKAMHSSRSTRRSKWLSYSSAFSFDILVSVVFYLFIYREISGMRNTARLILERSKWMPLGESSSFI